VLGVFGWVVWGAHRRPSAEVKTLMIREKFNDSAEG